MFSAATRLAALGALFVSSGALAQNEKGAALAEKSPPPASVRTSPTRPLLAAALPTSLRVGKIEYASVTDLATWLGLKGGWTDPNKKLVLVDKTNAASSVEFAADGREANVNGLRVFLGMPTIVKDGRFYVSRIDAERCLAPLLRPGIGAAVPAAPKIIVLDPGHGGEDPGAENKALGLTEKVLTLDIAQRAKKLLEAAGFQVGLTRTRDVSLSPNKAIDLALRADFANREKADLFVSIHFNAAAKDTRGTEVFSYAPRAQRSTDSWGTRVDDADSEIAPANRLDHWNTVLAGALHGSLLKKLKTEDRGKKIAHWAVLRTLACPGALVEPAIISNDAEGRRVATPAFRQQIAEGLVAGIRDYVATLDALRPASSPAAR
jgi:N-acetylmuramoyl-L-alanine amidase